MFNLGGTKEISGVTILVPRQDAISAAAALYPAHENTTRTYSQAIADALKLMNQGETSGTKWTADQSPPGVAKVLSDIWNFQIVQKYIPPFVAMQEYSSGGPFELKSKQGESLWMTYVPTPYGGAMNISGMSPEQRAGSPLPNVNGSVHLDGSPFAYTMLDFGDVIVDNVDSKVVVYRSDAVLLPLKMDPLGAYVGATASIFHLFASFGIALAALMLM
ncbi:unnamed protein product [Closterium sp. Yama58-4]|nr:unnamed protein product [Closterium sp. Yama58-4]